MNISRDHSVRPFAPDGARPRSNAARSGRALVECIVAALLLSVTMLALVATTRGTLAQSDDSALIARAQSLATTRVESAHAAGCANAATGTDALPRVNLLWTATSGATVATMHVDATLTRSPIAFDASAPSVQFALESGSVCP